MNKPVDEAKSSYQDRVASRIEALMPILAQAAVGDFSQNVPLDQPDDEFSELYVGVQLMVEVLREKLSALGQFNVDLESIVAARTNELYISEGRFRAVADNANDAIVTIDEFGFITYLNRAAGIIFGRPHETAIGKPLTSLVPGLESDYLENLPEAPGLAGEKLSDLVQTTAKHRNGRKFPVELSFASWQVGKETLSTVIIRDLTVHQMLVRKLAQRTQQLKERVASQNKLLHKQLVDSQKSKVEDDTVLSSIGEGVVATDRTGRIFFANREYIRLAGTALDQLVGRNFFSIVTLEDKDGQLIPQEARPMQKAVKTGRRVSSSEYYFRSADNRLFPVAITASPIIVKGKIVGEIDVIRDITKEKEVDRLKSEFVSLASHQLRTPATAVKGLLSLLIEGYVGGVSPEQAANLKLAFDENEHELKIIDDMLDVAKLDAGEIRLELTDVDMPILLQGVIEEQHHSTQIRRQNVKITSPTSLHIQGDASKLQMVFDNLLTNASKYSPHGSQIEVSLEQVGSRVSVHIKDPGIGIALKDISNLFKRFSRAANAEKKHVSGSGLGLYLAKEFVGLHHGRIEVESTLGKGSTFTVILPKSFKGVDHD